jgi:ribulose-5-phosphate 4-epimerase/fuculose-1-phosphate aldolase
MTLTDASPCGELAGDTSPAFCPALPPRSLLAIAARELFAEGYDNHHYGHITWRQADGSLLATPFGLGWDELTPTDILRIDRSGQVIEGQWPVSPAIALHTALHDARPDVSVGIHHHPRYATIWAARGEIPPAYDQVGAFLAEDDLVVFSEYVGDVRDAGAAQSNVVGMAGRSVGLLKHHGVLVLGETLRQAYARAVVLEWRCRQAWMVEAIGGASPFPEAAARELAAISSTVRPRDPSAPGLLELAVRRQLRRCPSLHPEVSPA